MKSISLLNLLSPNKTSSPTTVRKPAGPTSVVPSTKSSHLNLADPEPSSFADVLSKILAHMQNPGLEANKKTAAGPQANAQQNALKGPAIEDFSALFRGHKTSPKHGQAHKITKLQAMPTSAQIGETASTNNTDSALNPALQASISAAKLSGLATTQDAEASAKNLRPHAKRAQASVTETLSKPLIEQLAQRLLQQASQLQTSALFTQFDGKSSQATALARKRSASQQAQNRLVKNPEVKANVVDKGADSDGSAKVPAAKKEGSEPVTTGADKSVRASQHKLDNNSLRQALRADATHAASPTTPSTPSTRSENLGAAVWRAMQAQGLAAEAALQRGHMQFDVQDPILGKISVSVRQSGAVTNVGLIAEPFSAAQLQVASDWLRKRIKGQNEVLVAPRPRALRKTDDRRIPWPSTR